MTNIIEVLEENIRANIHGLRFDSGFLNRHHKHEQQNFKNWTSLKLKYLVHQRILSRKQKGNL